MANDGVWDQIKGNWKQFRGEVKQAWGDLTDDDLTYVEGSADKLVGKLQERYGWAKLEAETKVNEWARNIQTGEHTHTHSHDEDAHPHT
jgi:uncharacterized protein YjbJ (UPF0337 family)